MSSKESSSNYFLSQPHQPFFTLALLNAVIFMLLFMLSYKGILLLNLSPLKLHVYSLIFLVFNNVFTGFLFTTFPRFTASTAISYGFYRAIFFINLLATALFIVGLFLSSYTLYFSMLTLAISQLFVLHKLYRTQQVGKAKTQDTIFILIAYSFGATGHLLFLLCEIWVDLDRFAILLSFYMFVIFLTFSIAQRMVPFFSHSIAQRDERFLNTILVLFVLKLTLFMLDGFTVAIVSMIILDIILALYMTGEFLRWKLPLFTSSSILWVLYLGLFWLPAALMFSALSSTLELFFDLTFTLIDTHLLAIGFLTTIFIGFATRVTLGHSGEAPYADRFTTNLFWLIQVIVIMRALYGLSTALELELGFLFDISATLWIMLFVLWGYKYGKILIFGVKR